MVKKYYCELGNKPVATPKIAGFCAFAYFVVGVLLIMDLTMFIRGSYFTLGVFVGITLAIVLCLKFIDLHYIWFTNHVITVDKTGIEYSYDEIITAVGQGHAKDEFKDVTRWEKKKDKYILYGEFLHKEPLRKPKTLNKIDIPTGWINSEAMLEDIMTFNYKQEDK